MKYKTFQYLLGCLLIINIELLGDVLAPFYVEGTLKSEIFRDGNVVSQTKHEFEVWVDSPEWTIRMFDTDPDNERSYGAYGSDGENVYWYLWDQASKSENPESRGVPGRINEGRLPLTAHHRPFLVWFAFCSSTYLELIDENGFVPAPWANPRYEYYSAATDASMSLLSSGLPKSGEFTLTREAREEGLRRGWVESHVLRRAELELTEFPDGFLLGAYRVIEIGDFEIPRKVTVEVFWPDESGSTDGWLESVYTITVSNLQIGDLAGVGGPLEIPDGYSVSVADTRLRDRSFGIDQTNYRVSDGIWPVEPPEEAIAAFERNRERLSRVRDVQRESRSPRTLGIIALIVILGLLPVVIVFLKR